MIYTLSTQCSKKIYMEARAFSHEQKSKYESKRVTVNIK